MQPDAEEAANDVTRPDVPLLSGQTRSLIDRGSRFCRYRRKGPNQLEPAVAWNDESRLRRPAAHGLARGRWWRVGVCATAAVASTRLQQSQTTQRRIRPITPPPPTIVGLYTTTLARRPFGEYFAREKNRRCDDCFRHGSINFSARGINNLARIRTEKHALLRLSEPAPVKAGMVVNRMQRSSWERFAPSRRVLGSGTENDGGRAFSSSSFDVRADRPRIFGCSSAAPTAAPARLVSHAEESRRRRESHRPLR